MNMTIMILSRIIYYFIIINILIDVSLKYEKTKHVWRKYSIIYKYILLTCILRNRYSVVNIKNIENEY